MARNAREAIETFWERRLPGEAKQKKKALLALFSEERVSADLNTLKALFKAPGSAKGANTWNTLPANIPLYYAEQNLILQSFSIMPRDEDGTFIWDSDRLSQAFSSVLQGLHSIPNIVDSTSRLTFMLRASQWEHTRAYYFAFYWFATVGPQLVSTLIHRVQSGYEKLQNPTPLEKLANHICQYVHAANKKEGMSLSHSGYLYGLADATL